MSITRRHSSSLVSQTALQSSTPAFACMMSRRPNASVARPTSARQSSGDATSVSTKSARPSCSPISATVRSPSGTFTSPITTAAPSAANATADARPMPVAPPVTIATLSSSRRMRLPIHNGPIALGDVLGLNGGIR
jgi:hypothetical protein